MNHPEFTPEGNTLNIEPQDLLPAMLSEHRTYIRGAGTPRFIRGSGLFKSFDATPLLKNERKSPWNNLKSSARNAVVRVGQSVKNKIPVKTPKYDALIEEAESYETDESDDATVNDYSKDTEPLKTEQKSTAIACSVCQKEFANSCNLARHTKSVHSLIKFDCRDCGRSFARSDGLRVHMKICKKIPQT
jgi:uncharacterized Zn-finger protein